MSVYFVELELWFYKFGGIFIGIFKWLNVKGIGSMRRLLKFSFRRFIFYSFGYVIFG